MPTKPLDRLLFVQGGLCFFCKEPLAKADASVEHLVASANGGNNADENCVVCCTTMNRLLGSMALKEKLQVVLNQKGRFRCPNGAGKASASEVHSGAIAKAVSEEAKLVVANLEQRGPSKPKTVKTLLSTIRSIQKGIPEEQLHSLLKQLQAIGFITVEGTKVAYAK